MDSRDIKKAILQCIAENAQKNGLGKGRKGGRKGKGKKKNKSYRESKSRCSGSLNKLERALEALSLRPQSERALKKEPEIAHSLRPSMDKVTHMFECVSDGIMDIADSHNKMDAEFQRLVDCIINLSNSKVALDHKKEVLDDLKEVESLFSDMILKLSQASDGLEKTEGRIMRLEGIILAIRKQIEHITIHKQSDGQAQCGSLDDTESISTTSSNILGTETLMRDARGSIVNIKREISRDMFFAQWNYHTIKAYEEALRIKIEAIDIQLAKIRSVSGRLKSTNIPSQFLPMYEQSLRSIATICKGVRDDVRNEIKKLNECSPTLDALAVKLADAEMMLDAVFQLAFHTHPERITAQSGWGLPMKMEHSFEAEQFANLSSYVKTLQSSVSILGESVDSGVNVADSLVDSINKIAREGVDINIKPPTMVQNLMEKLGDNVETLFVLALFITGTYAVYTKSKPLVAMTLGVVATFYLSKWPVVQKLVEKFMNALGKYTPEGEDIKPQFGTPVAETLTNIGLSALIGCAFRNSWSKSSTVEELVLKYSQSTAHFSKVGESYRSQLEFILGHVEGIANYIKSVTVGGERLELTTDLFWDVKVYGAKVHELNMEFLGGKRDYVVLGNASALVAEGLKLSESVRKRNGGFAPYQQVMGMVNKLRDMQGHLAKANVHLNGQRVEPLAIGVIGPPGIGKTVMSNYTWPTVTARLLPVDRLEDFMRNPGSFVHALNQSDEFWSGYRGQMNVLVDEFGFQADVAGAPSVFSKMIEMKNTNPMNLNMANLEDKGVIYFTSEMVWWTSNRQHFSETDMHSISEPQALHRRLEFTYMVAVDPEYATPETRDKSPWDRRLDKSHKDLRLGTDRTFKHLRFHKITDISKGTFTEKWISYNAWVEEIINDYGRNKDTEQQMLNFINESVHDIVAERLAVARKAETIEAQMGCPKGKKRAVCLCPGCDKNRVNCATIEVFIDDMNYLIVGDDVVCHGEQVIPKNNLVQSLERLKKMDIVAKKHGCIAGVHSPQEALRCWYEATLHNRIEFLEQFYKENESMSWASSARKAIGILLGVGVIGAQLFMGYKVTSWLTGKATEYFGDTRTQDMVVDDDAESQSGYALKHAKRIRNAKGRRRAQFGEDPNAWGLAESLARRNLFRVSITGSDGKHYKAGGNILFVSGGWAIMPRHYFDAWADVHEKDPKAQLHITGLSIKNRNTGEYGTRGVVIPIEDMFELEPKMIHDYRDEELTASGKPIKELYEYTSNGWDFLKEDDEDCVLVNIPGIQCRDIVKHFRSEKTEVPKKAMGLLVTLTKHGHISQRQGNYYWRGYIEYEGHQTANAIGYDIKTSQGDCGSPFLGFDRGTESKILGIHVAGSDLGGYSIRICREDLEFFLSKEETLMRDFDDEDAHPLQKQFLLEGFPNTDMSNRSVVKAAVGIPMIQSSNIVPSPIHGKIEDFPVKTAPAMMRKTKGIDPMENAIWGYGMVYYMPEEVFLAAATNAYAKYFFERSTVHEEARLLSFEEAVQGIPGHDFANGINRGTSPGWPMRLLWKNSGKRDAFGFEDEYVFDSKEALQVKEMVKHLISCIQKNRRPFVVNNHFLKDERRPIEKANMGKTRLISSSPIDYAIAVRMYTLAFSVYVQKNRIRNGVAVGTNPFSEDWTLLAERHGNNDKNVRVIAGDFSGFDKTLPPFLLGTIKHLCTLFYNDYGTENEKIRNGLLDEICHSRHLCVDAIYEWMGSNPSGNPLTVIVNSTSNNIGTRIAMCKIRFKDQDRVSYQEAFDYLVRSEDVVDITTYGDDNVISVRPSEEFANITQANLTEAFGSFGFKYTDESKGTADTADSRVLSECSFLKRGFERNYGRKSSRWMAPLDVNTIMESIQWTKKHDTELEFWKANVDNMIKELSAHPFEVFKDYSLRIIKACNQNSVGDAGFYCPSLITLSDMRGSYKRAQEAYITTEAWL